ncbi:transmembrane protein [Thalictrum thalictroides]|uniref:Transmembrane protein n=1 Tax=Thalictrum thalictroides TaxID=46969 RepID=A0A7J6VDL6_THATH|nr:transmembrane protein [Thalictrum thalictroides]
MEALWNLEEKLKLTNQEAGLLFVCTALAVIGLCTMLKKKKKNRETKLVDEERNIVDESNSSEEPTKKLLMDYMRWSERSAWEDLECGSWQHNAPLLLGSIGSEIDLGWRSHNSLSPVWQRPILMGEKCELPRFSGLILYDEQGQPLIHSNPIKTDIVGTNLRDLL